MSPLFLCGTGGQSIGLPQAVDGIAFLDSRGFLLVFQQCAGTFHFQKILVQLLDLGFLTGFFRLSFGILPQSVLHIAPNLCGLLVIVLLTALQVIDLILQPGNVLTDQLDILQFLFPVTFCGRCQHTQVGNVALCPTALCLHSGDLGTDGGDTVGDLRHLLLRVYLRAFQQVQLLTGLGQLIMKQPDLGTDPRLLLLIKLTAALQSFHFLQGGIVGF